MPGCTFCGHANPAGATRCELCEQDLITPPGQSMGPPPKVSEPGAPPATPDAGFGAATPRGGTQGLYDATQAAPSRYDIAAPPPARESLPPPGWGPSGSTTPWSTSSGRIPAPAIPPPKMKRRPSQGKLLREIQGYLKVLALLAVGVVALVVFLQARAETAEFKITILADKDGNVSGTLVMRDPSGTELAKKTISESGARCPAYKRSDVSVRAKKSTEYVFEWNEVAGNSLTDAELGPKGYALVLDVRATAHATAGAPPQVC